MPTWLLILIIVLGSLAVLLVALLFIIAYFFYRSATARPRNSIERCLEVEEERCAEHNLLEGYRNWTYDDFIVKSFDGYELHCQYIPAEKPSKKYVIITHGFCWSKERSYKFAGLFRKFGYNAVVYDLRSHGENVLGPIYMGFKEPEDLRYVIDAVHEKFGEDIVLGLHGESLGSATTLMSRRYGQKVDFIVSDCGFSSLDQLFRDLIRDGYHLPGFIINLVNLFYKAKTKASIKDVVPKKDLQGNTVPICFIHGKVDKTVPPYMVEELAAATSGYKEVHITDITRHAFSYYQCPDLYEEWVGTFLKKVESGEIHA